MIDDSGDHGGQSRPPRTMRLRRRRRKTASAKEPATSLVGQIATGVEGRPGPPRSPNPIVPPRSVARRTLLTLVAIMSFLACLSVAAVSVIASRAQAWQQEIADEVTIQIKPSDTASETEGAVSRAVDIAMQAPGVRSATPIPESEANALLEPWLGSGFDASELPIPRLIAVRTTGATDLGALARRLKEEVPGASLDDHSQWLQRLSAMARMVTLLGVLILGLVFTATALCVVFATRGAMAGNRTVIEVLHFVGAADSYIAREFQRHFLLLGLKGAGMGGVGAAVLFLAMNLLARVEGPAPEEAHLRSLFGGLAVGATGYIGSAITVIALALIIALTARLTVRRTLTELD